MKFARFRKSRTSVDKRLPYVNIPPTHLSEFQVSSIIPTRRGFMNLYILPSLSRQKFRTITAINQEIMRKYTKNTTNLKLIARNYDKSSINEGLEIPKYSLIEEYQQTSYS